MLYNTPVSILKLTTILKLTGGIATGVLYTVIVELLWLKIKYNQGAGLTWSWLLFNRIRSSDAVVCQRSTVLDMVQLHNQG